MSRKAARSKIEEKRKNLPGGFAEWMVKAGLDPLDYELVEENRPDGVTA